MHHLPLTRRGFGALAIGSLVASYGAATRSACAAEGVNWHDISKWGVEGRGWDQTERYFDRLPAKAKGVVREPVWNLSRHSAGMCARFATDAREIHLRFKLLSPSLSMPHFPVSGVSGADLYATADDGKLRWAAVAIPGGQEFAAKLIAGLPPGTRTYVLYLPLYNGTESMEVGVSEGTSFEPVPPRTTKPIVFYGTSIMQGGCASRAGMAIPAILGRRLDRPTINLGFSGNGTMDASIGDLMGELDAAVYAIDCLPNLNGPTVAQRAAPLVRGLRKARPHTPIILVEDAINAAGPFRPDTVKYHEANRAALRAAYDQLTSEGLTGLHYLKGDSLLGDDGEATVDGVHPTDMGMVRYADAYEPALREVLKS